ncbi:MAG: endo-polygalacturonase, partial [Candidatus Symbiothrix sp.]|nr:endo-polygalacturonase [Candidatus Symbiothrix sp.]
MKPKIILAFFALFLTVGLRAQASVADKLIAYPAPAGAELNNDFTVSVRQNGQAWKTLASYLVNVDEVRDVKHHVENASMSYFDFSGEVEVSVKYNRGDIQTARVRPLS